MISVKTKKILRKITELYSTGYSFNNIQAIINKEFNAQMTRQTVQNIITKQAIIKKQVIKTDKEFELIHKEILMDLLQKSKANMDVLEGARKILLDKFEEFKNDIPTSKLMLFMKEISTAIRTQNDSIRSMSELLKRMETEKNEMSFNAVQTIQETVKILKDLEDMGYIEIKPDYYKSELYKENKPKEVINENQLD